MKNPTLGFEFYPTSSPVHNVQVTVSLCVSLKGGEQAAPALLTCTDDGCNPYPITDQALSSVDQERLRRSITLEILKWEDRNDLAMQITAESEADRDFENKYR